MEETNNETKIVEEIIKNKKFIFKLKEKDSFVLTRKSEESLWQSLFFSIFLFFAIHHFGIPDQYDIYFYLLALLILVAFIIQIRKIFYKRIEKYKKEK